MTEKKPVNFDKRRTLTLEEAENFYGISHHTLKKWIKRTVSTDGVPPLSSFKPGKEILVFREELEDYIKRFPAA
jgi:hypothetical protein